MKRMAVFVFSLLFLVSCVSDLDKKPRPTISHMLVKNPYLDVKWSKNDIDVSVDENMAMLVAAPNRVFALGQNIYTQTIYAFDSATGTLAWKQDRAHPDIIAAHDSVFYTTNLNIIYAYDIQNGDILWNNRLPYDGRLAFLTFYKDKIFTFSNIFAKIS